MTLKPGRQRSSSSRESKHGDQDVQADLAGPSRHDRRQDFGEITQERSPRRALLEHKRRDGRPQQLRPHHLALPRRRSQAALSHRSTSSATRPACRRRSRRSSTIRTAPAASRSSTTPTARRRYILAPRQARRSATTVISGEHRPTSSRATALPLRFIPLGTDDPQRRAARSARGGQLGRSAGTAASADGEGRRLGARCACRRARCAASTSTAARPSARSATPSTRNIQWGKAGRMRWLGHAPAQPRRHDEPGRSPDGRWRRPQLGWPSPVLAVGHADQGLQDPHNKRTDKFIVRRRGEKG